jgi:TolB protein
MVHFPSSVSVYRLLILSLLLFIPACNPVPSTTPTSTPPPTNTPTHPSPTITDLPTQTPFIITATTGTDVRTSPPQGVFFLSLQERGFFHLFAYSPQTLPLTRLSAEAWDDISPALSLDGNRLAFSSRRNGYWDLYLLDLFNGDLLRLTDTPEYDAAPSWSPDGAFIAYESYINGNLDIFIRSTIDIGQAPIQLTFDTANDYSPSWSPKLPGREIAFVSNRSGEPDVWIADLDHAGNFINVTYNLQMAESHPVWSPDGNALAWAALDPESGLASLYIWDARNPGTPPRWAGSGDWPIWQDNKNLASRLSAPNQTYLTSYSTEGTISIPPILLLGALNGLSYGTTTVALPGFFQNSAQFTPAALFGSNTNLQPTILSGRVSLVTLPDFSVPYPKLDALAGDSFQALRARIVNHTGRDALGNLETAFISLTTPLDPGLGEDWLFTGRAFTINPVLIQANWMTVVREDFGQQTYWRIYLQTAAQDGSQGMPLTQTPWDFSARTTSSTAYENGGHLMDSIPEGYWFDLTTLASQYGWERLPALANWRTYYAGARFNELVFPQGLDWRTAMLQLYPPEILITPTIVIPPTRTPTRTPLWYRSPTSSKTPTLQPTFTP